MASAIDTATVEPAPAPAPTAISAAGPSTAGLSTAGGEPGVSGEPGVAVEPPRAPARAPGRHAARRSRRGGRRWPISPLTRRILAVNVLALGLLAGGFLYLGKYQTSLIGQQIESLKMQGEIFAAALGEGAVLDSADDGEVLLPDLARQMMRRLVAPTKTRARLFDLRGGLIADSRVLRGPGDAVQILELPPLHRSGPVLALVDQVYDWVVSKLPRHKLFPLYRESLTPRASDYAEVGRALRGETGEAIRRDPATGGLVFSVAIPVQRYKEVLGALMLSTGSGEIEQELRTVRLELLRIFGVALLVTVLMSFYLAGTIVRPIRRLAAAAERARGRRARVEIPDFTRRGDEIGDLSGSLREMTDALWQRMSAIERFAADVAHEIKNPLGSLKSAVETAVRIEDPANQRRLMAIILDDVERLDRLITDISDASRLDAELSRLELAPVDIAAMLRALVDVHEATRAADWPRLVLELPERGRQLVVPGIETRLSQVFLNVIANAVSFSPPQGEIGLTARTAGRAVLVTVEDGGPGVPDDKLTAIFDRFYTERPAGEKFGTHSGLGLSISKQIVEAHRGMIWAENRKDAGGAVIGARFCIRLPALVVTDTLLMHATAVAIEGEAVLLRGPSGAGKSDLGLRLIDGGARLVADDQALLRRSGGRVMVRAPDTIAGMIEIRGVGIVRIEPLPEAKLALIADLLPSGQIERLPEPRVETVLGVAVPLVALAGFEAAAPAKLRLILRALAAGRFPAIIGR